MDNDEAVAEEQRKIQLAELQCSSGTLPMNEDDKVITFDRFMPSTDKLKSFQEYLTSLGTKNTGYCLMLDFSKITPEFLATIPQVFNYIEQVSCVSLLCLPVRVC